MYQRAKFAVRILCIVLSGALCFLSTACGKTPSSSPESSWDTGTASSSDQSASPSSDQSENPSQSVAVPENQTSSDGSTTGNRPSPSSKNPHQPDNHCLDRSPHLLAYRHHAKRARHVRSLPDR